jgi:hypothetical protein
MSEEETLEVHGEERERNRERETERGTEKESESDCCGACGGERERERERETVEVYEVVRWTRRRAANWMLENFYA